jgi:hypothetical protein
MCVHKRGARDDPRENIDKVGGVHLPSRQKFWMLQTEVITRTEGGSAFFVQGPDGAIAKSRRTGSLPRVGATGKQVHHHDRRRFQRGQPSVLARLRPARHLEQLIAASVN